MLEHILSQWLTIEKWLNLELISLIYGQIVIRLNFIGLSIHYSQQLPYMG